MAKQLINLGTPNGRDGDAVRVAFNKINDNFSELYVGLDLLNIATNVRPATSGLYDLGGVDRVWHALWLSSEGVHIGDRLLSVNVQGAITVDGAVIATPNGDPVQADWSAASGPSSILNKPILSAVATSNDYRQLSHKPTIPTLTSQLDNDAGFTTFSGSWTDLTNKPTLFNGSYLSLTNRPTLFSGSYLDLVHRPTLFSGSYLDLTNKPSIPHDVNQLTDVDSLLGAGGNGAGDRLVNGDKELVLHVDEVGTAYVTFPAVNGSQLGIQGSEISSLPGSEGLALSAREGSIILLTHGDQYPSLPWEFDRSGTINTPLLFPLSFTAVLDVEHRTVGDGTYTGPAWEFNLEWQVAPNGEIECISDNGPLPSLVVGYADGQTFEFTEADHGIPGYTLSIELYDVQHNPAGWTANLTFSAPPIYPSTINSQGAVKLTADATSFTFGADGNIHLPYGGDILDVNGDSVLGGGQTPSTIANASSGLTYVSAGAHNVNVVVDDLDSGGNKTWMFNNDGKLSLPAGGDIVDSNGTTVLGGGTGGGLSVSDFGRGFTDTLDAGKITTSKLYNRPANLALNNHFVLEVTDGGVVVLPDQSTINGATLKSVAGNYAGITAGPVGKDEDSWVYVDPDGAWVGTKYNTDQKLWHFDNNGALIFPSGAGFAKGDNGQLKVNDGVTLSLDIRDNYGRGFYTNSDGFSLRGNGDHTWKFDTIGDLTVPGDIKSTAGVGPVVIEANNGTLRTWTFGGDGGLTLPTNSGQSAIHSSGFITVGPTTPLEVMRIALDGHGVTIGGDSADNGLTYQRYSLGGTPIDSISTHRAGNLAEMRITADGESGGAIKLTSIGVDGYIALVSNSNEWHLGNTGDLTVPGDILAQEGNDLAIKVFNPDAQGGVSFVVQNRQVDLDNDRTTQFEVTPQDIKLTTDFSGNKNEWTFGADGTIQFPVLSILDLPSPVAGLKAFVNNADQFFPWGTDVSTLGTAGNITLPVWSDGYGWYVG